MQFSSDFFLLWAWLYRFILVSLSFWRSNYLSPFGLCRPSELLCLWHLIFALCEPGPENRRITIMPHPVTYAFPWWATPHSLSYAAPSELRRTPFCGLRRSSSLVHCFSVWRTLVGPPVGLFIQPRWSHFGESNPGLPYNRQANYPLDNTSSLTTPRQYCHRK